MKYPESLQNSSITDNNRNQECFPVSHAESKNPDLPCLWKGYPFTEYEGVECLRLPNGKILDGVFIFHNFMQSQLHLCPDTVWNRIQAIPTWPDDRPVERRDGKQPHWIKGSHPALQYRGRSIRRSKIWCQTNYQSGLLRYGYTGWQHAISNATADINVKSLEPLSTIITSINRGLTYSAQHNHAIVTRYADGHEGIGFHSDKTRDFARDCFIVNIKLGATRAFEFRLACENTKKHPPFYSSMLPAGTAVFIQANRSDGGLDANSIVEHGVPPADGLCAPSGSIVTRAISTVIPWDTVDLNIRKSTNDRLRRNLKKAISAS